ncbi:MAG: ketoacyl-ACP synthase III [Lentisphaeria bacterium]|nr:ketoacyl-ACP synthase III [Candidatus Neomarinimicrobiota bacterium]MCF7843081.1 ketoacyl-ACP synthase III [Lentisphaeria bacterium]
MMRAYISGIGMHVPEKVMTNADMEKLMDTSDEWITERSGIKERHFAKPGDGPSDLALPAAKEALEMANLAPEDIDLIIFSTIAGDYMLPGGGCILNELLKIPGTPALDIRVQCSGFVYGLAVARGFIEAGIYKNILFAASEIQSVALDLRTEGRDTAVLFGDGAGAVVLQPTDDENRGIIATKLHADGRYARDLMVEAPSTRDNPWLTPEILEQNRHKITMNGRNVFKHAITKFPTVIREVLEEAGIPKSDVNLVVPHQANLRISEAVANRLDLTMHEVVYSNIHKYGNTTSASIPIALYEAVKEGRVNRGDTLVLAAFGSGFTWGAAVVKW